MAPRVLVSDKLSKTAVQIFKDRGVEVDYQPDLGKDKEKLAEIIGDYDGLAIRSATKVTREADRRGDEAPGHRPRRHRRRQCRRAGGDRARHHRDEHALRQFDHHRRARHRADVRARPPDPRRRPPRPRPASGRRSASWASRSPARRSASSAAAISARSSPTARIGLKMKVIAFDPFLSAERAVELGVEKVELDELFRRADFITLHTPLTEKTQEHHRRGGDREDEGRRAHHQLRARRPGRRGGPRRGARSRARSPAPRSTSSSTEPAEGKRAVRPAERRLHAASRRRDDRGAGERRAPDRRADGRLSAHRRRLQRAQHAVDHGGGSAAAAARS